MKFTNKLAIAALSIACAAGSAQAAICGGVTGDLSVVGAEGFTPLTCTGDSSFLWTNDDTFSIAANLTTTTLQLTMDTGDTGGFQSDAFWTFTLAAGSVFGDIVTELSDTYALDSGDVPGGAEFVGFTDASRTTAKFRIIGEDHPYDNDTHFDAVYKVSVITTAVPEPQTWLMMMGGLGFVAYARRKRA